MSKSDSLNSDAAIDRAIDIDGAIDNDNQSKPSESHETLVASTTSRETGTELEAVPSGENAVVEPAAVHQAEETSVNDVLQSLSRLEDQVTKGVGDILRTFQDKLAFDRFKEEQITRLHEELQRRDCSIKMVL